MKTNVASASGINPVVILLVILAVGLIYAVLTGKKVPVLSTDRAALIGLVVIGIAICSQVGIGRVSASGAWLHPFSIIGCLLGGVMLIIGLAAVFGKPIPPLTNFHQSFIAVVAIASLNVILTTIHRLFLR